MIVERKTLYLDISQPRTENIHINAYDRNSRKYKIYLSDDGNPISLPNDTNIIAYLSTGKTRSITNIGTTQINEDGSFNFDFNETNLSHFLLQFRIETIGNGIFNTHLIDVSVGKTIYERG